MSALLPTPAENPATSDPTSVPEAGEASRAELSAVVPVAGAVEAPGTSAHAGTPGASMREVGGPPGPEPTRYGDWEKAGRCIDF